MFIYVITFLIFAAVLIAGFRAMGGEVVDAPAASAFLARMVGWVNDEVRRVADLDPAKAAPENAAEPLAERARSARKVLSGYQQQLQRFELDEASDAARLRSLISLAIESLGWACRMAETGSIAHNPAVVAAAAALAVDARRCLYEATDLVGVSPPES